MKILSRYVLKEHVGPLTFALVALTSLMLLSFISRQFGELVGKGLPWSVIGEFFLLSIPFTVALTVPMSVLVAVLYAFSRLAAENEITALKASGVSPWRLVAPAIAGGLVWSLGLLAFNDQALPRANHRLKILQDDISQTKPTFLLKEQVINPIAEGKFYLRADKIDRSGVTGRMFRVVIYDMADPSSRRTIYADSGRIATSQNRRDVDLDLYHGEMQQIPTDKPGQLNRLFYEHDRIRIKDVSRDFRKTEGEASVKGDREMSICEMQERLRIAEGAYRIAREELEHVERNPAAADIPRPRSAARFPQPRGIGWVYCSVVRDLLRVREAQAADVRLLSSADARPSASDTIPPADTTRAAAGADDSTEKMRATAAARAARMANLRRAMRMRATGTPGSAVPPAPVGVQDAPGAPVPGAVGAPVPAVPDAPAPVASPAPMIAPPIDVADARLAEARLRFELAKRGRNRYDIEIHKKFSLAAACLIFVLLGAPLAVRFPRGGVGLVLGVSLAVFALYYVGLIGGEALANEGKVPPFWAMWGTNVMLTLVGVVLLFRMGRDQNTGRGGDWGDRLDRIRARFGRGPRVRRAAGGAA